MAAKIAAESRFGNKMVSEADLQRAADAGAAILSGRDVAAVHAEYERQMDSFYAQDRIEDAREFLSGDAALWVAAQAAADDAFMPHSKGCYLKVAA